MNNRTERELYDRELRRNAEISRRYTNANGALLVGLFVATIAALGAVFYALTQQNQAPAPTNQPADINIELPQQEAPQIQPPEVNIQPPNVDINVAPPEVPAEEGNTETPASTGSSQP